jgi:hypothetical protein
MEVRAAEAAFNASPYEIKEDRDCGRKAPPFETIAVAIEIPVRS